ncbi:hypothetical protein QT621_27960, partial [Xanthomonas citri pv. citri]
HADLSHCLYLYACRHYHSPCVNDSTQYNRSINIECQYHHPSDGTNRLRRDSNRVKTCYRCFYYYDNSRIATGINACDSDNDHRACHARTGYYRESVIRNS